ncbi:MAG: hypothetical protein ACE367_12650 [Acidimicrobiales bacterium]
MSTEDRRRFPLWVPIAAAAAGAVVAFGAVAAFDLDRDEYVTVMPTSQPAAAIAPAESQPATEPVADQSTAADAAATSDTSASAPSTAVPETAAPTADQPATSSDAQAPSEPAPAASSASDTVISRDQAGAIAAAHVDGVVDSIHTENDYGAAWDVDVYAPDGEYTIYVSATGEIVRVEGPFRD